MSFLDRIDAWFPKGKIGRNDQLVGAALMIGYVIWLLSTARELGFPRDEGFYFHAAGDYARWFDLLFREPKQAMLQSQIDPIWQENHEHPSLMKGLFALSWLELYSQHKLFTDQSTAFRFPAMVLSSASLWITYLFGARAYSRRAGLVGALSLALMPHVFFHSHLACFDAPIMTMWIASIYVYWRSRQQGGLGWALLAGIVYGLTLETKHNAWILPAVFIPHALVAGWRGTGRLWKRGVFPIPASILSMAIVGPLVFYWLWPWLWNDTFARLQEYVNFHVNHVYYNIEYLNKNYFGPPSPRSYAPVMILATVPTVTLLLFIAGFGERIKANALLIWNFMSRIKDKSLVRSKRDPHETDLLLALGLSAPIAVFVLLTKTPIFGGTKHWMTAYPILAIFAGRGFEVVSDAMRRALPKVMDELKRRGAVVALAASTLIAPLHRTTAARSLSPVRAVGVRTVRGGHGGRRGPRSQQAVLGLHDRELQRVARGERAAQLAGIHPRHCVGLVGPHDGRAPAAPRPARGRLTERRRFRPGSHRAAHEGGGLSILGRVRDGSAGVRAHPRRSPDRYGV